MNVFLQFINESFNTFKSFAIEHLNLESVKKGGNNEYYNAGTSQRNSNYSDVRNLINTGRFQEAEQILNGVIMSNKGWLDDAYNSFQTACQMDPSNKEYNATYNRMKNRRSGAAGGYDRGGNKVYSIKITLTSSAFWRHLFFIQTELCYE